MYDQNLFASNLKYLREKHNVEQQELAEELGRKSGSTVSDWERGKATPNTGILTYIANRFGISLTELMETNLQDGAINEPPSGYELVPVVGEVAAGSPNYAVEDIEGYMTLPPDKRSNDGLFYLRVKSDSMDKIFPVGSYVLVDSKIEAENGDIVIFKPNGDEATLKRYKQQGHIVWLEPESNNSDHESKVFDLRELMKSGQEVDDFKIIGKVVGMYMAI